MCLKPNTHFVGRGAKCALSLIPIFVGRGTECALSLIPILYTEEPSVPLA